MALADEVCEGHLFLLWQGDTGLVGCFPALQEIGHVAGKKTHVLHALKVVHHVLGIQAVHAVPVAGADDGHLAQGKVLVQLIDGCRDACTPGTDHDCCGLQGKASAIAVEVGKIERFPFDAFLVSCYIPKAVEGGELLPSPAKLPHVLESSMKHGCDDIRKMVIDGYKNGKFTQTEASRVTGYSRVTIGKWCRNEEYTAKPRGHRAAAFSEEELTQLAEFIENNVDATLAEIREHFGKNCSLSSVHRAIQKIKFTFKKKPACR